MTVRADQATNLGVLASVVMDNESHAPRTIPEGEKQAYRDVCSGWLDDIPIVSVWTFHVALYALQNPTPENIEQALAAVAVDCPNWLDEETLLPLPVDPPNGWEVA